MANVRTWVEKIKKETGIFSVPNVRNNLRIMGTCQKYTKEEPAQDKTEKV